jgi:hypothetical protein
MQDKTRQAKVSNTNTSTSTADCHYGLDTMGRSNWHVKVKSLRNTKADPFKLVGDDDISLGQDLRLPTYILYASTRKGWIRTNDRVHTYQLRPL